MCVSFHSFLLSQQRDSLFTPLHRGVSTHALSHNIHIIMMFGKDPVWGGNGPSAAMIRQGGMMGGTSSGSMASAASSSVGGLGSSSMMGGFGFVPEKPQLCKYFVNGGCIKGDQCNYLHELPDERHLDVNGLGFIFNSNVHNAQKGVTTAVAAQVAAQQHQIGGGVSMPTGGGVSGNSSMVVSSNGHLGLQQPAVSGPNGGLALGVGGMGGMVGLPSAVVGLGSSSSPAGSSGVGAIGVLGGSTTSISPPASIAGSSGAGGGRKPMKKIVPKYRPPEPFLEHNLPPALAIPFSTSPADIQSALSMCMLEGVLPSPGSR